jgi:intracellular multiplication protein IcmJ
MRLLPLLLAAHPSAWSMAAAGIGQEASFSILDRDGSKCRFCGQRSSVFHEVVFVNGDRANSDPGNLATCCLICAAGWRLHRPEAEREALPIWLPEMSQRALNVLMRGLHITRLRHSAHPAPEAASPAEHPEARRASFCFSQLAARGALLVERAGIASVLDLPALFLRLDPAGGRCPEPLAYGMRLLHRGRHFVDGADVYSRLLAKECEQHPSSAAA